MKSQQDLKTCYEDNLTAPSIICLWSESNMPGDICLRTEKTSEVRKTNLTIFSRSFKKERTTKLEVSFVYPVENYLYKIEKKHLKGYLPECIREIILRDWKWSPVNTLRDTATEWSCTVASSFFSHLAWTFNITLIFQQLQPVDR